MENFENLLLEHLKRFQEAQVRVERKLEEITRRLSNLEAGQGSLIQHIGHLTSSIAQGQVQADHFDQRLEHIERRLEISG
ncbi:hypothetical protein [Ottowia sp.]|uniref:hypothetical protein n=1 Tax=Ottowia sp. TaxID=1898956 RepID=UPI0039E5E0E9